jgi:hypothetical protein
MWVDSQISVEIIEGDRDVAVFSIATPNGSLEICAVVVEAGRVLHLIGAHIQSNVFGVNSLGPHKLRMIADAVMKEYDYDAIEIEGAPRTTGAGKGRTPKPIRFARRDRTAP